MALDAGEVYVVCGAKLDSASIARANSAQRSLLTSSNEYQKAIDRAEASSNRLHAANERWARAAVLGAKVATVSVLGVATALAGAAVAAASFDASMRNVNSIAGLSEGGLKKLEKQVLNLSVAVGKSPKDLAEGLYSIVSSGFKAADAMKILTAGARAARAGLTDTATATGAITSVLNAYNLGAGDARKVSDLLFQTVNVGVLNFEQLAGSLGKVLPSAKGLGVSLKDLLAAEAALTLQGNSADEATTQLGQVMSSLTKPSVGLAKELKSLGFESGQAAIAHLGFKGTLDALGKAAHGNQALLAQWFGNIRAFRGVNGLEGTAHAVELFSKSVKAMDEATKGAGETQAVYNEQQKSTAAQFDHLKASIDVAAVIIGTALLPQINAGITALSHWLAEAQKSGQLQQWASDIAHAVSEVVAFIKSLGPTAEAAFHVVAATIQAAIPFAKALLAALEAIEPVLKDVAEAASGLAQALGPGPILAAAAAYLTLRRATLTAQAGVGTFSKIMQAGEKAIGTSGGGLEVAAGKYNKVGREAIKTSSFAKIAARGIASSFGPQLLTAGAAGIVLSLLYIKSTMTDLKKEAQDVVDAIAELQGTRLDVVAARVAQERAAAAVVTAEKTAGSRAVDLAKLNAADQRPSRLRSAAPTAAETQATLDLAKANLNLRDAINQRDRADAVAAAAEGARTQARQKLAQQLVGASQKSLSEARLAASNQRTAEIQQGRTPSAAEGLATQRKAVDDLAQSIRQAANANKSLDTAGKGAANRVADVVSSLDKLPTDKQFKIIADDVAAGKSLKAIKADLGIIDKAKPKPKVDADTAQINSKLDAISRKLGVVSQPKTIKISAPGANPVVTTLDAINTRILHLTSSPFTINVKYATTGKPPNPTSIDKKADGGKATTPHLAVWGEDGPEYLIPVGAKHRASGMALWLAAGKDLGVPGYAKGKKPGKTPPPVPKALGYDPQALDDQMSAEKKRLDDARSERDQLGRRIKTDSDHHKALEKQRDAAKKQAGSKNKKTAAAGAERLRQVNIDLQKTQVKIDDERAARKHQVDAVIPEAIKRYQAATRADRIGNDHAKKVDLWNARADAEASKMATASNQWDAADKKHDQKGKDKAYAAWDAARKARVTDLGQVRALLAEVMTVVKDTKYGATISGQLAGVIGDIDTAQDDTQAPGYVEPDTSGPTNLEDWLNPWEAAASSQIQQAIARASTTDDTQDDIAAAQQELALAQGIAARADREGAPSDIITEAYQALKSAQDDLASASAPSSATSPDVSADVQAQLDQQKQITQSAQANAAASEAALAVLKGAGDLGFSFGGGGGGTTINVGVSALTADSASVQRQVGQEVVKALGNQPYIPTSTGRYGG